MAFRVNHLNKKTGVTYVYEAVSVWDKEKKQSRNKQVCIGKIEPGKNEFVPSKRLNPEQAAIRDPNVTVTAKVVGPSLLLNRITNVLLLSSCKLIDAFVISSLPLFR
jgi:hypothetical protein